MVGGGDRKIVLGQPPDVTGLKADRLVTASDGPYLDRYHLAYTKGWCVRFHHWRGSDDQDAWHDHPWANSTVVLAGELVEHGPAGARRLGPGDVVVREATTPHAIELVGVDAWTLFATGPLVRRWGFHTDKGWVMWRHYPGAGHYEEPSVTARSRSW